MTEGLIPSTSLRLPKSLEQELLSFAEGEPGVEVCGLVFGADDEVHSLQATINVADKSANEFEIDPTALIAAHRAMREGGHLVIGCFHSHPNGLAQPSETDARHAAPDGQLWLIIAGEEVTAWRAVERGQLHGRFDPVPILRC